MLQGADAASRVPLPGGRRQVFVMPENLSAVQKEDVAWASYVLLRNTNTTSVVRIFRFSDILKFNLMEFSYNMPNTCTFPMCRAELGSELWAQKKSIIINHF